MLQHGAEQQHSGRAARPGDAAAAAAQKAGVELRILPPVVTAPSTRRSPVPTALIRPPWQGDHPVFDEHDGQRADNQHNAGEQLREAHEQTIGEGPVPHGQNWG